MGMPPLEQTWPKACNARQVNADLTEYDVPANADIGIDIRFVPEDDSHLNPLGVKSIGDSGIAGVAASIANAVHHATGKRVRSLPIALDKLL
jgi:xanthine dehydrogenase YagR molybdenum-binding subunit